MQNYLNNSRTSVVLAPDAKLRRKTYRKLAPNAKNHAPDAKICHRMYQVKISIPEDIL
jgi:hypothetical protein